MPAELSESMLPQRSSGASEPGSLVTLALIAKLFAVVH